jgi:hypothetical protein
MREKRRLITIRLSSVELENIAMASDLLNLNRSDTIRTITRLFLRSNLTNERGPYGNRLQHNLT